MAAWWRSLIPTKNDREIRRLNTKLAAIAAFEPSLQALSDEHLQNKTAQLRQRYAEGLKALGGDPEVNATPSLPKAAMLAERQRVDAALAPLLPEAFAVVREASRRTLGLRHYDVQMVGGMVLHEGKIAEMKTGEGKTLVATLPVYLNALAGRGVHVVTVNEYLASRDAAWMGKLYGFLGMETGVVVHGRSDAERQAAYAAPITYGTNSEFGFDYLRDNMKLFLRDYVQRGMHFAIVDEVDSILIDEARTPLIISGPAEQSTDKYLRINGVIPSLRREVDYTVDEKARAVVLTERGVQSVEKRLQVDNLYAPEHMETLHHVSQGLRAHTLYRRDVDYIVEDFRVKIIDEFTGRVLDGRRWSDGLHQAVEAKEGAHIENENQTLATITYQNYFRNFLKLCGMTGTAQTEAEEFAKIYDLDVVGVPTHRPMVRDDMHDVVYKTEREKFEAITEEIKERTAKGQPVLVGTISVEKSEVLSRQLARENIAHNVLNAKLHHQEAEVIAQAGRRGAVTIATNMAGRGTDILLGGNPQVAEDKEAVLQAGGLHILGTERHESRRIDNQLRGRAGRQGDPGSSRFYISLEDDLMRIFGGDRIMNLMERLGMKEGEVIEHPWINKSIENAQRRVEGHHFDVRKHLLEYDDVMNDQRRAIYKLRRQVLGADLPATRELVLDLIEDVLIHQVARACPPTEQSEAWDLTGLIKAMGQHFDLPTEPAALDPASLQGASKEDIEGQVFKWVEGLLIARQNQSGEIAFYHIGRIIYLQTIDALWKDHLREMDSLREGISLRGYAQKDPKQEYKKEGYNLFANTMATISADVTFKIFRVVITAETEEQYQARLSAQRQAQQAERLLSEAPPPVEPQKKPVRASATRPAERVGANDPCPCGSGKKFKKCHM
jgi:preprotein translocase subunit SecA